MGPAKIGAWRVVRRSWAKTTWGGKRADIAFCRLLGGSPERSEQRCGAGEAASGCWRGVRRSWRRGKMLWPVCLRSRLSARVRATQGFESNHNPECRNHQSHYDVRQLPANLARIWQIRRGRVYGSAWDRIHGPTGSVRAAEVHPRNTQKSDLP